MLEKGFVDIIQKISDEMGKDIFLQTKIMKPLLLDYTRNEFKKECSLLTVILDADSVNFINRAENLADCKQFLVERLEDDYSLSPQKSAEMLDLLFLVLRGMEIQAPTPVSAPQPAPQPAQANKSNAQAKDFFNQGLAFYNTRNYGPALQKFETALSLVDSWDTQLREDMRNLIKEVRLCAQDEAQSNYHRSQAAYFNSLAEEATAALRDGA